MKRILLLLLIGFSLAACAGAPRNMVEDQGSPAKVALLRERVNAFWTASVNKDYEKTFYLFDPFFQASTNKHMFIGSRGVIEYHSFEIKDIKVDGNVGHVTMIIVYSIPKTVFKKAEFSKAPTSAEFEETWLFVGNNWFKEYKTRRRWRRRKFLTRFSSTEAKGFSGRLDPSDQDDNLS